MAEGRWVPLGEGKRPAEGQKTRVLLEAPATECHHGEFTLSPPNGASGNRIRRNASHVVSVEVYEPVEYLVPGGWYMDADGEVARRLADAVPDGDAWGVGNITMGDSRMRRPLRRMIPEDA